MTLQYELFANQATMLAKNSAINTLLKYPNIETKTYQYRSDDQYEHPTSGEWAGVITDELIDACIDMSHEQKLPYYDDSDLKSVQWMNENGWFPYPEI